MKANKMIAFLVSLIVFLSLALSVSAHTAPSGINHDAANNKWDIYEKGETMTTHSSGNGIYVICDSSLTSASASWNTYVNNAISAWSNATFNGVKIFNGDIIQKSNTYTLSSSDISKEKTLVTIYGVNDTEESYWGQTMFRDEADYYAHTNSGKHVKHIRIRLNLYQLNSKSAATKQYTITHELGHVIGLKDLSSSFDDSTYNDCLMGYNNWTMLAPSEADIKGAAVISGYHIDHTMNQVGVYINENGNIDPSYHKKYCSECDGYTLASHVYSTYSALNGNDTSKHRKLCACGAYITEAHTWGEWTPSSPYTEKRVCKKCGRSEERAIGDTSGLVISIAPMYSEEQPSNGIENENVYGTYDMTAFQS